MMNNVAQRYSSQVDRRGTESGVFHAVNMFDMQWLPLNIGAVDKCGKWMEYMPGTLKWWAGSGLKTGVLMWVS